MLKIYKVTYKFYYDGVLENTEHDTLLLGEPMETEYSGTDFNSLWKLKLEHPWLVPWSRYERKKGKALGRWDALFCHVHEWKNDVKPWKVVITSKETAISMEELMRHNSDSVIQYLKERGIATCLIMK